MSLTSQLPSTRLTVIASFRLKPRLGTSSQGSRETSLCSLLPHGERENSKVRRPKFIWATTSLNGGPAGCLVKFEAGSEYDLQAWTGNLAEKMLARAQSISLDKFRINEDGRAVVPAQVRERDGSWHRTATAGRGSLSLRLLPLADVLAGAGILDHTDSIWSVSDIGQSIVETA